MLADSLPDTYGRALFDKWLSMTGRKTGNPVESLCYLGRRCMGALEFEPGLAPESDEEARFEIDSLVQVAGEALALGKDNGIRKAESIIDEVASAIRQFRQFAEECEVSQRWIGAVETTLNNHLAEWGLFKRRKNVSFRIGDTVFENVRVEKTYKGNYHLLCKAQGKEHKFVITNKKEEYTLIDKVGIDYLTDEQLYSLVDTFFVSNR